MESKVEVLFAIEDVLTGGTGHNNGSPSNLMDVNAFAIGLLS